MLGYRKVVTKQGTLTNYCVQKGGISENTKVSKETYTLWSTGVTSENMKEASEQRALTVCQGQGQTHVRARKEHK
jgi:hypothetical protein